MSPVTATSYKGFEPLRTALRRVGRRFTVLVEKGWTLSCCSWHLPFECGDQQANPFEGMELRKIPRYSPISTAGAPQRVLPESYRLNPILVRETVLEDTKTGSIVARKRLLFYGTQAAGNAFLAVATEAGVLFEDPHIGSGGYGVMSGTQRINDPFVRWIQFLFDLGQAKIAGCPLRTSEKAIWTGDGWIDLADLAAYKRNAKSKGTTLSGPDPPPWTYCLDDVIAGSTYAMDVVLGQLPKPAVPAQASAETDQRVRDECRLRGKRRRKRKVSPRVEQARRENRERQTREKAIYRLEQKGMGHI